MKKKNKQTEGPLSAMPYVNVNTIFDLYLLEWNPTGNLIAWYRHRQFIAGFNLLQFNSKNVQTNQSDKY